MEDFQTEESRSKGKGRFIAVLLIIAMFIPTAIAVANYIANRNSPLDEKRVSTLEMTDAVGQSFKFDKDSENGIDGDMIGFFTSMNNAAAETDTGIPEQLTKSSYTVEMSGYGRTNKYTYYFLPSSSSSYFVDADSGKTYKINEEYTKKFLSSEWALCLYDGAAIPEMKLPDGIVISPAELTWNYALYDKSYALIKKSNPASDNAYNIPGGIAVNFNIQPDIVFCTVIQNGATVYDGDFANIASAGLEAGSVVEVSLNAEWFRETNEQYFGVAKYKFIVNVTEAPLFKVSRETVEAGDPVLITGLNLTSADGISFYCEPSINYTPKFYFDGQCARAFIPIPVDTSISSYKFTLGAGAYTQNITVAVSPTTFRSRSYAISTTTILTTRNEEALTEYANWQAEVYKASSDKLLCSGLFTDPFAQNKKASFAFGQKITLENQVSVFYPLEGYIYPAGEGESVCAENAGTVVYTGELKYGGKTVVVDHGWGLFTTYHNLSSITAAVGDSVETRTVLGGAGSTGFAANNQVFSILSVHGVPVSIKDLWAAGVRLPD